MSRSSKTTSSVRRGTIVVMSAIMMVAIVGMIALAVDLGYIMSVRTELQVAADSAALAAAARLEVSKEAAIEEAQKYAAFHRVGGKPYQLPADAVEFGIWDSGTQTFVPNSLGPNSVRVRPQVDNRALFFAPVLGQRQFSTGQSSTTSTDAIALSHPRDIAFVIDLSGWMNDDSEFAQSAINTSLLPASVPDPLAPVAAAIAQAPAELTANLSRLYQDMNWAEVPGPYALIGQGLVDLPAGQRYDLLASDGGPLSAADVASNYRILPPDDAATRRQKVYRWIVEHQIVTLMPHARPDPNDGANFAYWCEYLDYLIDRSGQSTDSSWLANFNRLPNSVTSFNNRSSASQQLRDVVGYLSYSQFLLDCGHDVNIVGVASPLTLASPSVRMHSEETAAGTFEFPPRTEPLHSMRRGMIASLQILKERNEKIASVSHRDRVSIIVFNHIGGGPARLIVPLTRDYDLAMYQCTRLENVGDQSPTAAVEGGLMLARQHLQPPNRGGQGRKEADRLVFLVSGARPDAFVSTPTEIETYVSVNANANFYNDGGNLEADAALVQADLMGKDKWLVFPVGLGRWSDGEFLNRVARIAAPEHQNASAFDAGASQSQYEQRLVAAFVQALRLKLSLVQ